MHQHILFIILISLSTLSCKKSDFNSEEHTIKIDGEKRKFLLHESNQTLDLYPLVIALHGGTGSPLNLEEQSLLSTTSDEQGFHVCYPEGEHRTWNAGECCGKAASNEVNDGAFIDQLIDHLVSNYPIDPRRIYLTGMSNGGFMCYRLACEIGDKIAAIAPVAATMNYPNCVPKTNVPIIHFHSYQDYNVPWQGGVGDGLSDHFNPPILEVLTEWSTHNDCTTDTYNQIQTTSFDHFIWENCDSTQSIELYMTHDGGHSWPMGTKPRAAADEPSSAINANEVMWEFFQKNFRD